jgi:hypothetical protein
MQVNLVSLIMQYLTPDVVGRIGSAFGMGRESAQAGVAAGVPALLAGLMDVASKPEGASRLLSVLQQQAPRVVEQAGAAVESGQQAGLAEQGAGMLASLLGGGALSGIAGAVARFADIGEGPAKSLLGMLAPVVMGVLGQQQRQNGLDAAGLMHLLAGQKDAVSAAMPSGLGAILASTGLMGGSASAAARPQPVDVRPQATYTAPPTPRAASPAPREATLLGLPRNVALAVLALAVLALGYLLFWPAREEVREATTQPTAPVTTTTPPAATTTAPATTTTPTLTEADLRTQIGDVMTKATTALQGVTDLSSAQATLPQLTDLSGRLESISASLAQMTPETRKTLAGVVAAALPALRTAAEKGLAIPGVGDVARPVVDKLMARLESMATA